MPIFAQKQSAATIEKHLLKSEYLEEERELWIVLPENYSEAQKYPVLYILDAESLLEDQRHLVHYLSKKKIIPEMILVGLANTNRSLNMTHLADSNANAQPNGGGVRFEAFILKELIPHIDTTYATASYRILSGHSLGGLFATELFLKQNTVFNAYLLLDPALWWKDMEIFEEMDKRLKKLNRKQSLYLAIANSLPTEIKEVELALKDRTNASLGLRSVFKLKKVLEKLDLKNLNWSSKYYEKESHGTLSYIATYDGLKSIFYFYKRPSFQSLTDHSHEILDQHYKQLSEKMGYQILPSAYDLSGLAWRCMELDENYDRAYKFLELYIQYYPEDALAYMQMGACYDKIGEKEKAQEYYLKGIELGYDPNSGQ